MATTINNKVLTDAPLLDEIVYNCKIMVKGCVLKDEHEAFDNETMESLQNGDTYVLISEGRGSFALFYYDKETLSKIPSLTPEQIEEYAADNSSIPQEIRPVLYKIASDDFMSNYEELNSYYRCLNGLPDYGTIGLLIDRSIIIVNTARNRAKRAANPITENNLVPIHELSDAEIEILEYDGTLAKLREQNPSLKYLNHLGFKRISIYNARSTPKFGLLYLPKPSSIEVMRDFKERIELNRVVFLKTIYSEAYKFQSDYYDKFMMIMITLQSFVDMIVYMPEYIIRKDIFDLRTAQYIFESNGVEYFPEIPLRYQIALVKNLNRLVKFKSTDKCIVDICSLFGFNNVKVFKYYILKDRKITSPVTMDYLYKKREVTDTSTIPPTITYEEDNDENYDLAFIKVPIGEVYDQYIRDNTTLLDYDTVIDGDNYWNGDKDRDEVLSAIKEHDFNVLRSKYIAVEAAFDITELTFQMCYFLNILFHNDVDKSLLTVKMPNINNTAWFELVDIFILMYSMGYAYNGVDDNIMDTQGKVLSILGFNFEADLVALGEWILEKGYKIEDFGIEGFTIPDTIMSFNQLHEIYTTNKKIYDHVAAQLVHPEKKEIYDIYKKIYESLMIMDLNQIYYKLPSGETAKTFTEFLKYKDGTLYAYLMTIKAEPSFEQRRINIANEVTTITAYLQEYIDLDYIPYIFSNLPSVSIDYIKNYIATVINFFKSFKLHLLNISTIYKFEGKLENTIPIIDWMLLKYIFHKSEQVNIEDSIMKELVSIGKSTDTNIIDKMWLDIFTWVHKLYTDEVNMEDVMYKFHAVFDKYDMVKIYEQIMNMQVSVEYDDFITMREGTDKSYYMEKKEIVKIVDITLYIISKLSRGSTLEYYDKLMITSVLDLKEKQAITIDKIVGSRVSMIFTDEKYNIVDTMYKIITRDTN